MTGSLGIQLISAVRYGALVFLTFQMPGGQRITNRINESDLTIQDYIDMAACGVTITDYSELDMSVWETALAEMEI